MLNNKDISTVVDEKNPMIYVHMGDLFPIWREEYQLMLLERRVCTV